MGTLEGLMATYMDSMGPYILNIWEHILTIWISDNTESYTCEEHGFFYMIFYHVRR